MTITELPLATGEMHSDDIFCRRCNSFVRLADVLDAIAVGRPDDECPRCLTPSLALVAPNGLDID